MRDATTKVLGSASQVVHIPDLKKGNMAVSALTISQVSADGKFSIPTAVLPEQALSLSSTTSVPAIRRFRPGMILAYAYKVYNARVNPATGKPSLSIQMNLYRDGKLIEKASRCRPICKTSRTGRESAILRISDSHPRRNKVTIRCRS